MSVERLVSTRPIWRPPGYVHYDSRISLLTPLYDEQHINRRNYFHKKIQHEKSKLEEQVNAFNECIILKKNLENRKKEYGRLIPTIHNLAFQSKLLKEEVDKSEETAHHQVVDLEDEIIGLAEKRKEVEKVVQEHLKQVQRHYHVQIAKLENSTNWLGKRSDHLNQELNDIRAQIEKIEEFRTVRFYTLDTVLCHKENLIDSENQEYEYKLETLVSKYQKDINNLKSEYERELSESLNIPLHTFTDDSNYNWSQICRIQRESEKISDTINELSINNLVLKDTIDKLRVEIRKLVSRRKNLDRIPVRIRQSFTSSCSFSDKIELNITKSAFVT